MRASRCVDAAFSLLTHDIGGFFNKSLDTRLPLVHDASMTTNELAGQVRRVMGSYERNVDSWEPCHADVYDAMSRLVQAIDGMNEEES